MLPRRQALHGKLALDTSQPCMQLTWGASSRLAQPPPAVPPLSGNGKVATQGTCEATCAHPACAACQLLMHALSLLASGRAPNGCIIICKLPPLAHLLEHQAQLLYGRFELPMLLHRVQVVRHRRWQVGALQHAPACTCMWGQSNGKAVEKCTSSCCCRWQAKGALQHAPACASLWQSSEGSPGPVPLRQFT